MTDDDRATAIALALPLPGKEQVARLITLLAPQATASPSESQSADRPAKGPPTHERRPVAGAAISVQSTTWRGCDTRKDALSNRRDPAGTPWTAIPHVLTYALDDTTRGAR